MAGGAEATPDLFLQEICRSFWSPEASGEGTGAQPRPLILQRIYSQAWLRQESDRATHGNGPSSPGRDVYPGLIIELQYIRN